MSFPMLGKIEALGRGRGRVKIESSLLAVQHVKDH